MLNLNGKLALASTAAKAYKNINGETTGTTQSATNVRTNIEVRVGSGTTAPTVNDTYLESVITTLSKVSSTSSSAYTYGDNYSLTATTTYENNTDSDVTVTELGMVANATAAEGTQIMIAREVIDPVTIPVGGQKTFTLTIG